MFLVFFESLTGRNQNCRKLCYDRFKEDFDGHDDDEDKERERELIDREATLLLWLTNKEFLPKNLMSHVSFKGVLMEIKDHAVFKN